MFAIVRTGGKQYRVSPGDRIVVEKLAGEAGERVTLGDVLLSGTGGDVSAPGAGSVAVEAEVIAQARADKVVVFKKRRRHNYRRKAGHRQNHTILKIVSVGGETEPAKQEAVAAPEPKMRPAEAAASKLTDQATEEKPLAETDRPVVEQAPAETPAVNEEKPG